jgi:hypothetical protein
MEHQNYRYVGDVSVITVVITSKTQIKEKELKVKKLGYLPRVLFFNAFELGAESANQVLSKEALRSIVGVFSTMN